MEITVNIGYRKQGINRPTTAIVCQPVNQYVGQQKQQKMIFTVLLLMCPVLSASGIVL